MIKRDYGVTAWRIDSEEAREVASKADASHEWRRRYADWYALQDSQYYEIGLRLIAASIEWFGLGRAHPEEHGPHRRRYVSVKTAA